MGSLPGSPRKNVTSSDAPCYPGVEAFKGSVGQSPLSHRSPTVPELESMVREVDCMGNINSATFLVLLQPGEQLLGAQPLRQALGREPTDTNWRESTDRLYLAN